MNTDPIADLLTRMRNAMLAGHKFTTVPYSKTKENILVVLKNKGVIESHEKVKNGDFNELVINFAEKDRALTIKRVSKPGQRIYIKSKDIRKVKSGMGMDIISTSKGLMTGEEARSQNLGGEVICKIY